MPGRSLPVEIYPMIIAMTMDHPNIRIAMTMEHPTIRIAMTMDHPNIRIAMTMDRPNISEPGGVIFSYQWSGHGPF